MRWAEKARKELFGLLSAVFDQVEVAVLSSGSRRDPIVLQVKTVSLDRNQKNALKGVLEKFQVTGYRYKKAHARSTRVGRWYKIEVVAKYVPKARGKPTAVWLKERGRGGQEENPAEPIAAED